jgi:hypothetical protein
MSGTSDQSRPASRTVRSAGCAVALAAVIAAGVWLVGKIQEAREAARHTQCRSNIGQLYFALLQYHEIHGTFPPANIADADGRPMHSWRVLILPFIDQVAVYEQYRFDEPWDGPHNSELANRTGDTFHCPSGPNRGGSPLTDYVVIVGPDTAFPGAASTSLSDITDGPENTVLLAEIAGSNIHWMEPRDLQVAEMSFVVNDRDRPSISGPHSRGPAVVFADRLTAYRLDASLRPATLRAMSTIAGGERVSKEDYVLPSDGHGARLGE